MRASNSHVRASATRRINSTAQTLVAPGWVAEVLVRLLGVDNSGTLLGAYSATTIASSQRRIHPRSNAVTEFTRPWIDLRHTSKGSAVGRSQPVTLCGTAVRQRSIARGGHLQGRNLVSAISQEVATFSSQLPMMSVLAPSYQLVCGGDGDALGNSAKAGRAPWADLASPESPGRACPSKQSGEHRVALVPTFHTSLAFLYAEDCEIAPVAQLDRALASGARGRRFESCRAYHRQSRLRVSDRPRVLI